MRVFAAVEEDSPADDAGTGGDAPPNFVDGLGLRMWPRDGLTHGRAEILPGMLAPGTDRVRLGVLATMVDMVAGSPPTGAINPTVDLRIVLLGDPPASGEIHLVCRPAKVGNRLVVGETLLDAGDPDRPFARSVTTFINRLLPGAEMFEPRPLQWLGATSYDECLLARHRADGGVEMDLHEVVRNGIAGTIQGGAQALLAELAAEHALGRVGAHRLVDLEIRYLNRAEVGPVVARGEVLARDTREAHVRVPLVDAGAGDRLVSLTTVRAVPVSAPAQDAGATLPRGHATPQEQS